MKTVPLPDWSAQGDAQMAQAVIRNTQLVIQGNQRQIEWALAAVVAGGHVLVDGTPGTGKTLLGRALSISTGLTSKRITGSAAVERRELIGGRPASFEEGRLSFNQSALFANILLVDDIDRLNSGVCDFLLECMEEKQLSVQGQSFFLPLPFSVIATKSQDIQLNLNYSFLDRFMIKISLDYPGIVAEANMLLNQQLGSVIQKLRPVCEGKKFARIVEGVFSVVLSKGLATFIAHIVAATRTHPSIERGASTRAVLSYAMMARALCYIRGVAAVNADVIREIAVPVLAHRLILKQGSAGSGRSADEVVREILALQNMIEDTAPAISV